MQFLGTKLLLAIYIELFSTIIKEYIQFLESTSVAYIQPSGTKSLLTAYTLLSKRSTFAAYITLAILNISISYSRKLSNFVKIYSDNAKYSGYNNNFIFKLMIFHDICFKADISPKTKMKAFSIMFQGLTLDYYYLNINISAIAINLTRFAILLGIILRELNISKIFS